MTDKLLVVAAYDSQLKVACNIAAEFSAQGWELEVRVPRLQRGQLNRRQVEEFSSFGELNYCSSSVPAILKDCMSFSAILLILDGHLTQAICYGFYASLAGHETRTRPVIITGFVGVGLFDTYVGYQRRLLSDVLFLNANKDLQDCREVCDALGIDHRGLVVSGLPFVGSLQEGTEMPREISSVLFAGQPDVPDRMVERLFVLEKMIEYARRFPEREVFFKPRHKPGERTLHRTRYHFETLAKTYLQREDLPANFEFVYGPLASYLERTQLLITVSSTAVFEALGNGVHGALVSDLGISERYGNNYFMGSGMLSSFSALYEDHLPILNWEWIREHMEVDGSAARKIYEATVVTIDRNAPSLLLPYDLHNLQERIATRLQIEAQNKRRVIKLHNLAEFFLRRAISEKRIF